MLRAFVALGLVVSVLLAFKDGLILKDVGLFGGCDTVATPAGFVGEWRACRRGAIDGWPDLRPRGCTEQSAIAGVVYWICPPERRASGRLDQDEA